MRELELLIASFEITPDGQKRDSSRPSETSLSPPVILDTIRRTVQVYKDNLDKTAEEVGSGNHVPEYACFDSNSLRLMLFVSSCE